MYIGFFLEKKRKKSIRDNLPNGYRLFWPGSITSIVAILWSQYRSTLLLLKELVFGDVDRGFALKGQRVADFSKLEFKELSTRSNVIFFCLCVCVFSSSLALLSLSFFLNYKWRPARVALIFLALIFLYSYLWTLECIHLYIDFLGSKLDDNKLDLFLSQSDDFSDALVHLSNLSISWRISKDRSIIF